MDADEYFVNLDHDQELLLRSGNGGSSSSKAPHRQGSLVRPERNRFDNPNDPHFYYAQKTKQQKGHLSVLSSTTGVNPTVNRSGTYRSQKSGKSGISGRLSATGVSLNINDDSDINNSDSRNFNENHDEEYQLQDLSDRQRTTNELETDDYDSKPLPKPKNLRTAPTEPISIWRVYCWIVTFWIPSPLIAMFGMPKKERQMAWREKFALITVIIYIGGFVAYLTFGFSRTVCGSNQYRIDSSDIDVSLVTISGKAYRFDASSSEEGSDFRVGSDKIYGPWTESGKDASFLFQNVNGNCHNIITPKEDSTIPHDDNNNLAWYFPCKAIANDGSSEPDFSIVNYAGWGCHTTEEEREAYYKVESVAEIYYDWEEIRNSSRNLVVYNGNVLDLNKLNWLETDELNYPPIFDDLKDSNLQGYDLSIILTTNYERKVGRCLSEIIKVGEVDSKTVGCIASDIVLYVSLVFILAIVGAKFLIACYFRWFVSRKQGAYSVDNKTMDAHMNSIEDWSQNVYSQGPIKNVDPAMRPINKNQRRGSRFDVLKKHSSKMLHLNDSIVDLNGSSGEFPINSINGMTTMTIQNTARLNSASEPKSYSRNVSTLFPSSSGAWDNTTTRALSSDQIETLDSTIIHPDVVQQPPVDYMPHDFPLIHTICFVTCYSEDEEGLRTTLDSLSTTDYPNSHKLIMVVCDGLIKGSGNDKTTPEIVLDMMDDFVVEPEDVKPYSYVAVTTGNKRHNMAKIYSGFYKYDDSTVPTEKQQRVPMITIVKCGTPDEQGSAKPGNRGKRDSQIILMSFLQRITFDERMTELEFQLLKNIWQITGLMSDFYETVIMVDADTKVFPDSLSHMVAEMTKDPSIMGLCGETKIANKSQSWVTAIQVYEYYISHHQSKAFESVFGSVTCLPGCFSMYRIKSPKGTDGYWVPILANPDIVERYSDNVTDTLHKKNLLLLGEDRYLSSLMLRTFPKRKQVFVPKAACKTIVPDTFKVLLSQRRRWINSTVHNLFELVLIRDLCGTFCFSMQFVIGIELIGTLVLPLALCFTIYVIIFAIVSHPTPILTLILLALILGLPGVLVVITASRLSYLGWMVIYIIALPVWNFILPSYAYWKFDDFSWGDTRTIAGGNKTNHEDELGEFDHSKIKMRTWREFDREERFEDMKFNKDLDENSLFA